MERIEPSGRITSLSSHQHMHMCSWAVTLMMAGRAQSSCLPKKGFESQRWAEGRIYLHIKAEFPFKNAPLGPPADPIVQRVNKFPP